ncbi:hypothetical protein ACIRPS_11920 [Streptomyces griseoviridis]
MRKIAMAAAVATSLIAGVGVGLASSSHADAPQSSGVRLKTTLVYSKDQPQNAHATCPDGYVVTGGGGGTVSGSHLDGSFPDEHDPKTWSVFTYGSGVIGAVAVCAQVVAE